MKPDPRFKPGAYVSDGIRLLRAVVRLNDNRIAYENCACPDADCVVLKPIEVTEYCELVKEAP
jgi:hypothetical protein